MRSYGLYIDGQDVDTERWIHVIRASALFDDAFGLLRLKRRLDRGEALDDPDPRVVARVGYATQEECAAAPVAARAGRPAPADHRCDPSAGAC